MKNKFYVALLLGVFSTHISNAQENNKNNEIKDIFSVKAGFLGAWLSYEKAITKNLSVNSEIGYEGGLTGGNSDLDFILTSSLALEPKFDSYLD